MDSSLGSGGVIEIYQIERRANGFTLKLNTLLTDMSVESFTGSGVKLHIPDLAVLAEGSADVSLHQLIPGSAFECEVDSSSAIPET